MFTIEILFIKYYTIYKNTNIKIVVILILVFYIYKILL